MQWGRAGARTGSSKDGEGCNPSCGADSQGPSVLPALGPHGQGPTSTLPLISLYYNCKFTCLSPTLDMGPGFTQPFLARSICPAWRQSIFLNKGIKVLKTPGALVRTRPDPTPRDSKARSQLLPSGQSRTSCLADKVPTRHLLFPLRRVRPVPGV